MRERRPGSRFHQNPKKLMHSCGKLSLYYYLPSAGDYNCIELDPYISVKICVSPTKNVQTPSDYRKTNAAATIEMPSPRASVVIPSSPNPNIYPTETYRLREILVPTRQGEVGMTGGWGQGSPPGPVFQRKRGVGRQAKAEDSSRSGTVPFFVLLTP